MKRGELFLVTSPSLDPKRQRVFVIVSRQELIDSRFSTVIGAPVDSTHDGLSTQVAVGVEEGLKHESSVHCDALMSIPKSALTRYVGILSHEKLQEVDEALKIALSLDE